MRLMVVTATYHFGLGCGVGAGKLSDFFHMLHIEEHVGVSESSVQKLLRNMEGLLPEFQKQCEQSVAKKPRQVVAAMDETFFGQFMIMVVIDLKSGYLLLEDIADDRCYETWHSKITPRLESLEINVTHAISDRAKALIKLAVEGFGCESGADTFHAQYDISKWLAAPLSRLVEHAKNSLGKLKPLDKEGEKEAVNYLESCQKGQSDYHKEMQGISDDIHPFSLKDNQITTANHVESELENRAVKITELAERHGLSDNKNTVQKFRNQIKSLAVSINFWWLFVHTTLGDLGSDEQTNTWVAEKLLPVIYWHHQKQRTQNISSRGKYQKAWERASQTLKDDPLTATLTENDLQTWVERTHWMVRHFHRSSSAVEGRNGCLSQMYHNGRGFTEKRLAALTVIHNYGIKHPDSSTAASRFFEQDFPDPLTWLLEQVGELPLPRRSNKRAVCNPLILLTVPS
ncbi:MAG: DUF6399 domain-containing protein [Mariprofundus sp.]|nr:DUF6399 domain-containing protein [Mariprofundus sp.]